VDLYERKITLRPIYVNRAALLPIVTMGSSDREAPFITTQSKVD
jgi:hypothetical protein